jgi:broad specificity phosphatase PhoE
VTTRVILIAPALTRALREARFSGEADGPAGGGIYDLDAAGLRQAQAARGDVRDSFPAAARVYVSPSLRCRSTAEALGLDGETASALAPCAMGRWQGRTLDEVAAGEPESVAAWLADPSAAPHGGESLLSLHARIAGWLDALGTGGGHGGPGPVVAVAEPDIIRAAVVHALGVEHGAFWRVDVRPLSVTEFSGRNGRWNLLSGRPLRTGRH